MLLQVVELYLPSEKVTMYMMHSETHTKKYLKYKVTIYSIVMTLRIKHYNLNKYI
ncbi:Uncharacterised protein [Klebsiella pneumoniae]|nr:Uncharacterised protein [Klebsiella pneumoniae]